MMHVSPDISVSSKCVRDCTFVQAMQEGSTPSSPSQQGKELKGLYREQYSELQMVKAEGDYTQKLVEQCTHELVMEFQEWYAQRCHGLVTLLAGL